MINSKNIGVKSRILAFFDLNKAMSGICVIRNKFCFEKICCLKNDTYKPSPAGEGVTVR